MARSKRALAAVFASIVGEAVTAGAPSILEGRPALPAADLVEESARTN